MSKQAEKTDPELWERVKEEVVESGKGGRPGQWSARKAQLAVQEYKHEGGGYRGKKAPDNSLQKWQDEEWGTKSGKKSLETGERYLPKRARETLTAEEYKRTSAKKRADTRKGKQFSKQPAEVAVKAAKARKSRVAGGPDGVSKAELMREARGRNVPGRSTMSKAELARALDVGQG